MFSLFALALVVINSSILAVTAPVLIPNHALLSSPPFNTPLPPPPPFTFGSSWFSRLPKHQMPYPVGRLDRSSHNQLTSSPAPDSLNATTVTIWVEPTPVAPATTVSTASQGFFTPSEVGALTKTVTVTVPVTTFTPEASTITVTAGPTPASTSNNTNPSGVRSMTILQTVPFTTTDLPAVTVTGLQTLTSVVVIPMGETATAKNITVRPLSPGVRPVTVWLTRNHSHIPTPQVATIFSAVTA